MPGLTAYLDLDAAEFNKGLDETSAATDKTAKKVSTSWQQAGKAASDSAKQTSKAVQDASASSVAAHKNAIEESKKYKRSLDDAKLAVNNWKESMEFAKSAMGGFGAAALAKEILGLGASAFNAAEGFSELMISSEKAGAMIGADVIEDVQGLSAELVEFKNSMAEVGAAIVGPWVADIKSAVESVNKFVHEHITTLRKYGDALRETFALVSDFATDLSEKGIVGAAAGFAGGIAGQAPRVHAGGVTSAEREQRQKDSRQAFSVDDFESDDGFEFVAPKGPVFGPKAGASDFAGFSMGGGGGPSSNPAGAKTGLKSALGAIKSAKGQAKDMAGNVGDSSESIDKLMETMNKSAKKATKDGVEAGAKAAAEAREKDSYYAQMSSGAIGGLVDGFLSGDVKGGIKSFAKSLGDTVKQNLKKSLMESLGKKIFSTIFGGGLGGLLGGGGAFADGGRPPMGRYSMVGEEGPELVKFDSPATVIPNHELGGGGITVENLHLTAGSGPGDVRTIEDIAQKLAAYARAGQSTYFHRQLQPAARA